MKLMLTSAFGGECIVNGVRESSVLIRDNGLLDNLRAIWQENARVLIISADPCDYDNNDTIRVCLGESFPMSGLSISSIDICDNRNPDACDSLAEVDVLVFAGGHVPTQNRFMKRLCLRERLIGYDGVVLTLSAGSMNCADTVYACPELDGEANDPTFQRWISGLGLTDINIFPHFQYLKDKYLDGSSMTDIIYGDSVGHEIFALNDGSYILIIDGEATLYGEAYSILDGKERLICRNGEVLAL